MLHTIDSSSHHHLHHLHHHHYHQVLYIPYNPSTASFTHQQTPHWITLQADTILLFHTPDDRPQSIVESLKLDASVEAAARPPLLGLKWSTGRSTHKFQIKFIVENDYYKFTSQMSAYVHVRPANLAATSSQRNIMSDKQRDDLPHGSPSSSKEIIVETSSPRYHPVASSIPAVSTRRDDELLQTSQPRKRSRSPRRRQSIALKMPTPIVNTERTLSTEELAAKFAAFLQDDRSAELMKQIERLWRDAGMER